MIEDVVPLVKFRHSDQSDDFVDGAAPAFFIDESPACAVDCNESLFLQQADCLAHGQLIDAEFPAERAESGQTPDQAAVMDIFFQFFTQAMVNRSNHHFLFCNRLPYMLPYIIITTLHQCQGGFAKKLIFLFSLAWMLLAKVRNRGFGDYRRRHKKTTGGP